MRQRAAGLVALVGGLIGVAAAWLTWTVSGSAERNSYASLRAAQRLDLGPVAPFRVIWFLVPVAVVVLGFLLALGVSRAAGVVGAVIGLVLVSFGIGMLTTTYSGGVGPWLSCVGGVTAMAGGIAVVVQGERHL